MKQTPAHEQHNPDLLTFIPKDCRKLVEVGCSSGALAREYRKLNPGCCYVGVEIDADYAERAVPFCSTVHTMDIEAAPAGFFAANADADCWVFGDALEHLRDPWRLLAEIRRHLPLGGQVVACVPNVQHWSVQARLACGVFRYEDEGLLDRTHLRWFTRSTLIELFAATGFRVVEGLPRVFAEPEREAALAVIRRMAEVCGADPEQAVADAKPMQFVVRALPV